MSDFDAIDSLLAGVAPRAVLPAAEVRRGLRERAHLSKAQVARALGVSPSTVGGWESGRDPVGETRTKYAYLLDGLRERLAAEEASAAASGTGEAKGSAGVEEDAGARSQEPVPVPVPTEAAAPEAERERETGSDEAGAGAGAGAVTGTSTSTSAGAGGGSGAVDGVSAAGGSGSADGAGAAGGSGAVDGGSAAGVAGAADGVSAADASGAGGWVGGVGGHGRGDDADDVEVLLVAEACVLCGRPAMQRMDGFAQHLDPADCGVDEGPSERVRGETPGSASSASSASSAGGAGAGAPGVGSGGGVGERGGSSQVFRGADFDPAAAPPRASDATVARTAKAARTPSSAARPPRGRAFQAESAPVDLVHHAVQEVLAAHQGDVDGATAALLKRAIPDAMRLLDETRKGARYDVVAHPWIPDILRKQTAKGADQIWEARPKWTRGQLPAGAHEVTALDVNGAYLSALKTHLPIGQLEHSSGFDHDRRRAGVHLITPPRWDHEDVLPNPIGNRDEPGPLWVTEPTLRLLLRLSGPKHKLCEPPEIHESFTSGATENLLEKFRIALKDARDTAIAADDEVTLEYVKAMYSKFVSTMGESNFNRELYRPDWMHLIRSQAFSNLWLKALKAYDEGLHVVRAMGTDELHVIGDWRRVFPEGRGVTEVKVKDTYTVGSADGAGEEA